jgi:hypothetical protein
MPFPGRKPGTPKTGGRVKGVPNKITREIRVMAGRIVNDSDYRRELKIRLRDGKAPHMETLLWQYAYGKPKETIEHSGEISLPTQVIVEVHPT